MTDVTTPTTPGTDPAAALTTFGHAMQQAPWRFATTMPDNPHHYTLREDWNDDAAFDQAVTTIRRDGYTATYRGRRYTQLDVNEHFYWTMGAPLDETILINRKRRRERHPYDTISARYDTLFRTPEARQEERDLLTFIEAHTGPLTERDVLDVGCGTGTLLNTTCPRTYTGIDPSAGMLALLHHRHPNAAIIQTDLTRYVPSIHRPKHDVILALFGVASYLTPHELARIPHLLNPGGTAITMYYRPDHEPPYTYTRLKTNVPHHHWNPEHDPGTPHDFTTYLAVITQP